jgi:hypothetical protein
VAGIDKLKKASYKVFKAEHQSAEDDQDENTRGKRHGKRKYEKPSGQNAEDEFFHVPTKKSKSKQRKYEVSSSESEVENDAHDNVEPNTEESLVSDWY